MSSTAAAHVFVTDLARPELSDVDRHHLEHVLRLRPGEEVTASDGAGGLVRSRFGAGASLELVGEPTHEERPSPAVVVGFALVKSEKPEWIVQKLTECGVDRIAPFAAERSVVRWDEAKAQRNVERLQRVAREAAMQSRQRWLPTVDAVRPFEALVAEGAALADAAGEPPSLASPFVLVGPEGGWSDGERRAANGRFVRFGRSVLRSETAAIAAGVLLTALRESVVSAVEGRAARS